MPPHHYTSADEDSARWRDFPFRDGDIVVSTRSKHGTTWVQTILLLLIHQTPALPAPLAELSPWLDHLVEPLDNVLARLEAQQHRRVIKTHTPLDGIPLDPRATYIAVGRHPLDAAVSLYHQGDNLDREKLRELTGADDTPPQPRRTRQAWLRDWIADDPEPRGELDSLPGVMWHWRDVWARRDEPNIVLVHYADLQMDLEAQMRGLADHLHIDVSPDRWPRLVEAATLKAMRANAATLAPNAAGVLRDTSAFFRRGSSGAAAEVLSDDDLARYERRLPDLIPRDLSQWLHR